MDKHLELIWKYIDGELSSSEIAIVEDKLKADPVFNAYYKSQLNLHQSLKTNNVVPAPMNFAANVMAKLQGQVVDLKKYDSFAGVKGILIWTLAIVALAIISIYIFPPIASTGSTAVFSLDNYTPEFLQSFSLSNEVIKYSSYFTLFLIVPIFLFADNLLRKIITV